MSKAYDYYTSIAPNFMTPDAFEWFDLPDGRMVELSEGRGFDGEPLYGVTVHTAAGEPDEDSCLFFSEEEMREYVEGTLLA